MRLSMDPFLYSSLAWAAFLLTFLTPVIGIGGEELRRKWAERHGEYGPAMGTWSLRNAIIAALVVGSIAGAVLTPHGYGVTGDPNPVNLLVFAWLGLAVAMAPITLVFAFGTVLVMAGFAVLTALVGLASVFWWVFTPFALVWEAIRSFASRGRRSIDLDRRHEDTW